MPPRGGADLALGIDEARRLRRHAHVRHLHQHEGTADDPSGRRGNDRLVEFDAQSRHRVPHVNGEIPDVGTDREIFFFGRSEHRNTVVAFVKAQPGFAQFVTQRIIERVVCRGTIHGDGGDVARALVANKCHGIPPRHPHDGGVCYFYFFSAGSRCTGSIHSTVSGFSTGSMSRLIATASPSLRTSTHSSTSSRLALIS